MKNKYHINQSLVIFLILLGCESTGGAPEAPDSVNVTAANPGSTPNDESSLESSTLADSKDTQNSETFIATWPGPSFPAVDLANSGRFKNENGCVVVYTDRSAKSATVIFPSKTRLSKSQSGKPALQLPNGQNLEFDVKYIFSGNSSDQIPGDALDAPIPKQCPQTVFAIGDITP
jgi:hypothetical protein